MSTLDPLESLVSDLEIHDTVHTVHYSSPAGVELVVEDRLIEPEILRQIADHGCRIVDPEIVNDLIVVRVEVAN